MKLFVFGSTGDLIKRKVLPTIQELNQEDLEVYALGRKDFNKELYRDFVCNGNCNGDFKERLHYIKIDYDSKDFCDECLDYFDKEKINYFYVALPPGLYKTMLISIGKLK